jgi:hypothetical protein
MPHVDRRMRGGRARCARSTGIGLRAGDGASDWQSCAARRSAGHTTTIHVAGVCGKTPHAYEDVAAPHERHKLAGIARGPRNSLIARRQSASRQHSRSRDRGATPASRGNHRATQGHSQLSASPQNRRPCGSILQKCRREKAVAQQPLLACTPANTRFLRRGAPTRRRGMVLAQPTWRWTTLSATSSLRRCDRSIRRGGPSGPPAQSQRRP